jgi:DNA-directed RNA polymerase specialized sigma24 family protein
VRELYQVGQNPTDEEAVYRALSDAELTERIRAGAAPASPALQELKRRHLPAVLTYARLCGRNQVAGNQLAVQAFDRAAQEACRGIEPRGNWRHHLLMLVQQTALAWAADSRRDRLESDFVGWIEDMAEFSAPRPFEPRGLRVETSSAMLTGFYRLPELTRGTLWYGVVDEESDATVATFLSVTPESVPDLRDRAQDAMRQAYIQAYLETGGNRRCLGYRRIIEAGARPGDRRYSADLTLHLAECPSCSRLVAQLSRMEDDPRTVFAEDLLEWGGRAYAASRPVRGLLDAIPAQPDPSKTTTAVSAFTLNAEPEQSQWTPQRMGTRRLSRRVVLVAVAVAAAVVVGTWLANASGGSSLAPVRAEEPPLQEAWPPVALPAAVPSTSPSREPSKKPSPSPSPTTSAPTTSAPAPAPSKPAPSKSVPRRLVPIAVGGYTHVVNWDSGLCLDILNGVMENRTDVVIDHCSGTRTQQWSLDSIGLLRSKADPDYCLDSRGDTYRGVGIWSCASVYGRNGLNLLFTIDGSGAIRPRVAPDFALEPLGTAAGSPLGFDPSDKDSDQLWTTGASPKA